MNSTAPRRRPLLALPPTETIEIGYGLSLAPRLKLLLTFFRSDPAVKPVDEWQLKLSLLDFLRSSLHLTVPDDDLVLRKRIDLHKRKRDEPVASGTLYIRDLGFIKRKRREDDDDNTDEVLEKKFSDWRASFLDRLSGIELNLEGVKFRMTVEIPPSDDYEMMKRMWEDYYASHLLDGRSYSKGVVGRPDTIIVQGVPSRWFAEPRVSSKPSMLNTHTIFSVLGNIRNLHVAGSDDIGENSEAEVGGVVPGLQCKVWVQFENYDEFSNAMRGLCGRSMQKILKIVLSVLLECLVPLGGTLVDPDLRSSPGGTPLILSLPELYTRPFRSTVVRNSKLGAKFQHPEPFLLLFSFPDSKSSLPPPSQSFPQLFPFLSLAG